MSEWIYVGNNRWNCPKCNVVVNNKKAPKKCPICGEKMKNAFGILFPPNNWTPKKDK